MGLKSALEYQLKFNPAVNRLYTSSFGALFRVWGKTIKMQDNLVLFVSDIGRSYTGSPQAIYERMLERGMGKDYELVWGFTDPDAHPEVSARKVKLNSREYFNVALQAKFWVTDVNIERGLIFKKPQTRYLNTWHGSAIKAVGKDIINRLYYDCSSIDWMCASSEYDVDTFSRAFSMDRERFIRTGLPRNDYLFEHAAEGSAPFKEKLGLPLDKKVILYAPTWRDSEDGGVSYDFKLPIHVERWQRELGDSCHLVFRLHPHMARAVGGIATSEFYRDMTGFQPLNDLLLASDLLLTDYSSLAFEFSILKRPVLCYAFDADLYKTRRGTYMDVGDLFPRGVQKTEDELLDVLKDESAWAVDGSMSLPASYNEYGGTATDQCIELLFG